MEFKEIFLTNMWDKSFEINSKIFIKYKDEDKLLHSTSNVDKLYIKKILPTKMNYNLKSIENFSFLGEIKTMIKTIFEVVRQQCEN